MRAVVLARRDFRENDQIISLYTEERGKLEVLSRGVKKIISKNSAHLEPFSLLHVEIVPGAEITHLTRVQPLSSFKNIRTGLRQSQLAGYAMAGLDKILHPHEPDRRIFGLLVSWLDFLDKAKEPNLVLLDAFVIKFFYFLGFDITQVKKLPAPAKKELMTMLKNKWDAFAENKNSKSLHRLIYRFAIYHSERKLADWTKTCLF